MATTSSLVSTVPCVGRTPRPLSLVACVVPIVTSNESRMWASKRGAQSGRTPHRERYGQCHRIGLPPVVPSPDSGWTWPPECPDWLAMSTTKQIQRAEWKDYFDRFTRERLRDDAPGAAH